MSREIFNKYDHSHKIFPIFKLSTLDRLALRRAHRRFTKSLTVGSGSMNKSLRKSMGILGLFTRKKVQKALLGAPTVEAYMSMYKGIQFSYSNPAGVALRIGWINALLDTDRKLTGD